MDLSYERFVCYGRKDTTHERYQHLMPKRKSIIDERAIYHRIDVDIIGMNPLYTIEEKELSTDYMHYTVYEGEKEKKLNLHRIKRVIYKNIYHGIDLEFMMQDGQFKFNWMVHPGADVNQIKLKYKNAKQLIVTAENTLLIKTELGILEESLPASFLINHQQQEQTQQVAIHYQLNGQTISYKTKTYPSTQTLIIDPTVTYQWGSYIATFFDSALTIVESSGQNYAGGACDQANNSYLTGYCLGYYGLASKGTPWDTSLRVSPSAIAKFNPSGQLLWGMYWSSFDQTDIYQIKVDQEATIWLTGRTNARRGIATKGTYLDTFIYKYGFTAFISRLDSSGDLMVGTYLSNKAGFGEEGYDFAFDSEGNVVTTGSSHWDTLLGTPGTHRPKKPSNYTRDAYIVKFSPALQRIWGTYYGGIWGPSAAKKPYGIAVDKYNNVYIAGYTDCDSGIATPNCYKPTRSGFYDGEAFFAKFSSTGQLLYGSYYGTRGDDGFFRILIDSDNNLVMSGIVDGPGMCTPGVFDTICKEGIGTSHIVVFDSLMHRKYACNIAGPSKAWDLELRDGDYMIAGEVQKGNYRKFTNANSPFENPGGNTDGYVIRIAPELDSVRWGTYIGGKGDDMVHQIGIHEANIFVFGLGSSKNRIGSAGTHRPNHPDTIKGANLCFMMQLVDCSPALQVSPAQYICEGDSVTLTASGAKSYLWQPFNSTQSSIIVKPKQSTVYAITGSDTGSCSITKTVKVKVVKAPNLSMTLLGKSIFCIGDSVALKVKTDDSVQLSWTQNGQVWLGQKDTIRYAKSTGIYAVKAVNNYQCSSNKDTQVWANIPVKLIATRVGDSMTTTPAKSYQWYVDSIPYLSGKTQSVKIKQKGKYQVATFDSLGCESWSDPVAYNGIAEFQIDPSIIIYPNPLMHGEQLYIQDLNEGIKSIQLVDLSGRDIQTTFLHLSGAYILNPLSAGIYILKIQNNQGKIFNQKIVVVE